MARTIARSTLLAAALNLVAACGSGGEAPAGTADAALTSGQTAFARKLGGAGIETAAGIATCRDGSIVAASYVGPAGPSYLPIGLTRISASGQTLWAKVVELKGEGGVVGLACSPLGNVFIGLDVRSGSVDFGGGAIFGGAVVKLTPAGEFTWQHAFANVLESFAVDGNGSVLAGLADQSDFGRPWHAVKLRWDGAVLWELSDVSGSKLASVRTAWDPAGNAIVADDRHVRKYTADGKPVWTVALSGAGVTITGVGTTAIGTVVVTGSYGDVNGGTMSAGDKTLTWKPVQSAYPAFAAAIEGVDGYVRWLANRASTGPMAVDPIGRIVFIDTDGPMMTGPDCRSDLARWDLTGKELWRRPLVTCVGDYQPGHGATGTGVAIGPKGEIWGQGWAFSPFDPGTGTTMTPQASDWFILRVAP